MPSRNGSSSSDSSSTRLQRNLAEKQRRYKLNGYISELANIVPMVSMSSKRLDKTSILRLSAAHLRIYQSALISRNKRPSKPYFRWRPNFLDADNIWKILEAVDGFLLVTTGGGKIMYISQSVEQFLGHQNIEMIGHSLLSFIHPSDAEDVQSQLDKLVSEISERDEKASSGRCSFYCRIRERGQPRSEVITYQLVHIMGHMSVTSEENEKDENSIILQQMNCLLKAFVRIVHTKPLNELSLTDAIEDEYVTRHSLDGTIIFSDHRLSTITGHLPHEVFGRSAYHYIIPEDIPVSLFAHKLMFTNKNGQGFVIYRLRTSNQGRVFLKTSGYLQYDKSSAKFDHFMCINKLMSDEEGDEELKKFNERFTPHITESSVNALFESIQSIQVSGLTSETGTKHVPAVNGLVIESKTVGLIDIETNKKDSQLFSEYKRDILIKDNNGFTSNSTEKNSTDRPKADAECNDACIKLFEKAPNLVCGMPHDFSYPYFGNSSVCTNNTLCSNSEEQQTFSQFGITDSIHLQCNNMNVKNNKNCFSEEYKTRLSGQCTKMLTLDSVESYSSDVTNSVISSDSVFNMSIRNAETSFKFGCETNCLVENFSELPNVKEKTNSCETVTSSSRQISMNSWFHDNTVSSRKTSDVVISNHSAETIKNIVAVNGSSSGSKFSDFTSHRSNGFLAS